MPVETVEYADFFAEDRSWLESQVGADSVVLLCERMGAEMARWIQDARTEIGLEPMAVPSPPFWDCFSRVWKCWRLHWQTAASDERTIDVWEVGDRIRGHRPRRGDRAEGTNLVLDVVLADALLRGEEVAIAYFDMVHLRLRDKIAQSFGGRWTSDSAWWQDLTAKLIGSPLAAGALSSFIGRGSLRSYVRTCACRYIGSCNRRERAEAKRTEERAALAEHTRRASEHELVVQADECAELFRRVWREVLGELGPTDRVVIKLVVGEQMRLKDAARIVNRDQGTLSRTRQRVFRSFRERVFTPSGDFADRYRDCGTLLFAEATVAMSKFSVLFRDAANEEMHP